MFNRFRSAYVPDQSSESNNTPWLANSAVGTEGYVDFVREFAGISFAGGLYRVHNSASGARALDFVGGAFPEFRNRAFPFGFDWLGRQFALDFSRTSDGQPLVVLLEPGTGEALEIPVTFLTFHEEELIDFADAALARNFFQEWIAMQPDVEPLSHDKCVGYRVPLFLGGKDVVENLEVSDIDVYWSICGQLRNGTRNLPPGTSVNEIAGPLD
ncbi:T6SS immunity protein Tdi1 domain-containing protein [Promicromonospora sp. NPDC019610]|uniref:T6SS immunity protein Tdi1 domain-containing protein n=1 Tax=Promicromonospora sp. NPDC019610 TaxID=3364405 RepID=UPI0037A9E543